MANSIYIGLGRQAALREEMNIIANNVANINTPGFKKSSMLFREYLYAPGPRLGAPFSSVQGYRTHVDMSEGPIEITNNPLDVAISGSGFFLLETPVGQRLTRVGRLQVSPESVLVNSMGHPVLDDSGAQIEMPTEGLVSVSIGSDGTLSTLAGDNNVNNQFVIAKIGVYDVADPQQLRATEAGMLATNQEVELIERPRLVQGALEQSNVVGVLEMTKMIDVLRTYQSAQRFSTSENDRIRQLIRSLGSLNGS